MSRVESLLNECAQLNPHRNFHVNSNDLNEISGFGRRGLYDSISTALDVGFALGRRYALNEAKKARAQA